MGMKIYISGKITGDPGYRAKFERAADEVHRHGGVPLNPATLPDGLSQGDYMRLCLAMMDCADGVLLLSDWEDSHGARIEREYAEKCGKSIVGVLEISGGGGRVEA